MELKLPTAEIDLCALVLTEAEAARILRLSPRTLQRMRLDGGGPRFCRLTEKRIGYDIADLQTWVSARSVASTAEAAMRQPSRRA